MKTQIRYVVGIALLAFSFPAQATLIMTITDAGGGNSRFEFSGSAIVDASPGGLLTRLNGIWINPSFAGGGWLVGESLGQGIVSGGGTSDSTGSIGGVIFDIFTSLTDGFAPRDTNIRHDIGDVISWSGDLISSTPFSNFVSGVYSSNVIGQTFLVTLDSDYILTIGPRSVPEPESLTLMGLGLLVLVIVRRGKAANSTLMHRTI